MGDPLTRSGKIGRWYVRARCVDNSIKIGVYRKGRDPLTKKPWANKAIAKDVLVESLISVKNTLCLA